MRSALVTGITGQDGSYLAELLLEKGYRVHGFARRETWLRPNCASHLAGRIAVVHGDMSKGDDIDAAVRDARPDEVYNLASQSRPSESWARAIETFEVNSLGAVRLFEAVRRHCPGARVCHASSCDMFGEAAASPQGEDTPLDPVTPYAASKAWAHQAARMWRDGHGMRISTAILFNHESERRPLDFAFQKVAYGAACASLGIERSPDANEVGRPIVEGGRLAMGNLEVARDWGHARDFVRAMWLMLQQEEAGDFVIGTGESHTLRDLCGEAYGSVGLEWQGRVVSDPALARAKEPRLSVADRSRARRVLGWEPEVGFGEMVRGIVAAHIERLRGRAGSG